MEEKHDERNEKMEVQELRKIEQNKTNMKENGRQHKKKKLKANKPQNKSQVYKIIGYYFKLQD